MTRSSEFCWIAEMRDGRMLRGLCGDDDPSSTGVYWTRDPEMALRIADGGRGLIQTAIPSIGFRKVLAS